MAKKTRAVKKEKQFVSFYPNVRSADRAFLQHYDPSFLKAKAAVLYGIYQNFQSFKRNAETWDRPFEGEESYLRSLLATELHVCSLHQSESMLAFLLAEFQPLPDWVYLTKYGNPDMKNAARDIVSGNYEKVTEGRTKSGSDFVKSAVFVNRDLSTSDGAADWHQSIDDISWLIEHVASHFLEGNEYNAYKHGLRVVSGSSTLAVGETVETLKPVMQMEHSMEFLRLDEEGDNLVAQRVIKEIRAEYSFQLILAMSGVLALTKAMRIARIDGSEIDVNLLQVFRDRFAAMKPVNKFEYPY